MTVLCTDKTGTLTSAEIGSKASINGRRRSTRFPARDRSQLGGDPGSSMRTHPLRRERRGGLDPRRPARLDFSRRVGSVLTGPGFLLIVKGALEDCSALCTKRMDGTATPPMESQQRADVSVQIHNLAGDGLRCIAVASRPWSGPTHDVDAKDEADLVFEGLCAFADPPKPTAATAIARLAKAGIRLKILSGDDPVVVKRLAGLVGLKTDTVLSGADIVALSDDALAVQVQFVDAYGRLAPDQKSRIIKALQARGAVVGFLGDGINDAPGLKVADIGLSVDGATGVAQAAADMILLESDLGVVADGVEEGRRTFANILKYVRMGASSNFGNMLSMAVATIALPFLPMLPTQILLNNLLYDLSEIGIPFDTVRPEATVRPQVWDIRGLVRFAAIMGPMSSLFDFLTLHRYSF
jgi:Mg2+-importing ATPase